MDPFIGQIIMFAGNFAPRGWALCEGQILSINQYQALFSILGTTYGGDGRTSFALPDLRGRVPTQQGTGPGLTPRRLGERFGSETNTIVTSQLPAHHHNYEKIGRTSDVGDSSNPIGAGLADTGSRDREYKSGLPAEAAITSNTGGGQPVNNMQPTLAVNYIIALIGTYPSRS